MNTTLEPYVKKLLDGGMKTAEDVASFIEKQTPELGREMITWGAISASVWPILGLLLIAGCVYLHKKFGQHAPEGYYDCGKYGDHPPGISGVGVLMLIGILMFALNILDVVYPLVAPRLYILEKISGLIK
jgi:hypothetical protein